VNLKALIRKVPFRKLIIKGALALARKLDTKDTKE
jgi:hypothetical protein